MSFIFFCINKKRKTKLKNSSNSFRHLKPRVFSVNTALNSFNRNLSDEEKRRVNKNGESNNFMSAVVSNSQCRTFTKKYLLKSIIHMYFKHSLKH
jgi:hypothetical protein